MALLRVIYVIVFNLVGVLLGLLVGSILMVLTTITSLKLAAAIGVGIFIYTVFLIGGFVAAILDPLKLDD